MNQLIIYLTCRLPCWVPRLSQGFSTFLLAGTCPPRLVCRSSASTIHRKPERAAWSQHISLSSLNSRYSIHDIVSCTCHIKHPGWLLGQLVQLCIAPFTAAKSVKKVRPLRQQNGSLLVHG